ncbi:MAG: RecX family transcriptional regulator [Bacteroidales bacterium]|jgi:regulatory protein|nr:RecX family transcriptional regulator [Bacteroidales bacterium]MCK9500144.1 RecX family transcriptional regulator [Bacteroidales bacterium]MDY0315280.1 regulatory protein RecX [Bacteroidales bacterium]NLB86106.1 RecX family transcriptional regulator [Bacteroidales bacterium]
MTNEKLIKQAFSKAANYCSKAEKCNFDVYKYLEKYDYEQEIIEIVIKNLNSENYIDENRYSTAYVNDKFKFSAWGKIKISYMLRQKNIPNKIIDFSLNTIDNQEYENSLFEILKLKLKNIKSEDKSILKEKLLRFASSRGFEFEIIYKVLDRLEI